MKQLIRFLSVLIFVISCNKDELPSDITTWNNIDYAFGVINNEVWQPDSIIIKPTNEAQDLMDFSFVKINKDKTHIEILNLFSIPAFIKKTYLNANFYYPIPPRLPRIEFRLIDYINSDTIRALYLMDDPVIFDSLTNNINITVYDVEKKKISGNINSRFFGKHGNLELKDFKFSIGK